MKNGFDINHFKKNSIVKFYYERGRHTVTSLRAYKDNLYVHKLLGYNYSGVSDNEYMLLLKSISRLGEKIGNNTTFNLPKTYHLGYNKKFNCIEKIEKYSGNSLRYHFPTSSSTLREATTLTILEQLDSLVGANGNKMNLDYSIDPTPDNFTFDGRKIYLVDLMPPLIRGEKINPQFLTDKSRSQDELDKRLFRYLSQKGLYLTFLTKFGPADVSFFDKLFELTLSKIKDQKVKEYLYNDVIRNIEKMTKRTNYYYGLKEKIKQQLDAGKVIDRDMLRLIGLYFIKDMMLIKKNSRRYRIKLVNEYLGEKRCTADIVNGIVYSKYRGDSLFEEFKELIANLIALQYGK